MIIQQLSLFETFEEIDLEDSDENYTPEDLIKIVHDFYGFPSLDPFSNSLANKVVKAKKYFSKQDDGLQQDWEGYPTIWMNPPYSRGFLKPVVDKLIKLLTDQVIDVEVISSEIETIKPEVFLLTNTDNSTQWYQLALRNCDRFILPTKRLTFYSPKRAAEGKKQSGNDKPQTLFYFGQQPQKVEGFFRYWGTICQTSK